MSTSVPTQSPQFGAGKPTEVTIDKVNVWMRSQPWYQQQLKAWGQDPQNTHLSKSQSEQLLRMAQAQGVQVDQGNMEVDPSGNFNPKGHKLRNTLIVAGLAGATIATMGAAGAFAGAGGMAGGAAGGAASGAASAGATAAGAGVSAAGIGTGGLVGSGLSATSLGLGTTAGLGTAGALGSTAIGTGLAGGIAGGTGVGMGTASGGGLTSTLMNMGRRALTDKGTEMIGNGLARSAQAQAMNRGTQAELMLDQNDALERQLLAREQEKRSAQSNAFRNMIIGDRAQTWEPLARPDRINPEGRPAYAGMTPAGKAAGGQLFQQALQRMQSPDLQNQTGMPAYNDLSKNKQFTDTQHAGLGEKAAGIGSWGVPLMNALLSRK